MSARLEELDWQETPLGEITLRRRLEPSLGVDVFEVKLGDEYLMSSLFPVAEIALSHLGIDAVAAEYEHLDILVGGLGLGYTAEAALTHARVRSLTVIEALAAVIDWHERGLLPVSHALVSDARTRLVQADYFALMRAEPTVDLRNPDGFHAILVDIDHTPRHLLNSSHGDFYSADGLRRMARHLAEGGIFALWSDDPPDPEFESVLSEVFATTASHIVAFPNPLTGGESTNTVYLAGALRR